MSSRSQSTVLIGAKLPERLITLLNERYEVFGPLGRPFTQQVNTLPRDIAERVRALVTMGTVDTTREALAALPAVGIVCCLGSGYEGVDFDAARERGIAVTHSPRANSSTVADLALGLLIASVRNMFAANAYLRSGDWENKGRMRMTPRGLTGRRMGVYGLGAIGEKIALRASACEMEVGYHNRNRRDDVPYPYFGSLRDLTQWADVLMIAVRAGPGNRHAVDAGILAALGADGHVINISRGSVIDEAALIHALEQRTIAGAGLDVYEKEPVVPEVLRKMTNVALTPHIGGDAYEAYYAMSDMVITNLEAFFSGRPVLNPVPM